MYLPVWLCAENYTVNLYSCCLVAEGWVTSVSTGRNALHTQHFIRTCTHTHRELFSGSSM